MATEAMALGEDHPYTISKTEEKSTPPRERDKSA